MSDQAPQSAPLCLDCEKNPEANAGGICVTCLHETGNIKFTEAGLSLIILSLMDNSGPSRLDAHQKQIVACLDKDYAKRGRELFV